LSLGCSCVLDIVGRFRRVLLFGGPFLSGWLGMEFDGSMMGHSLYTGGTCSSLVVAVGFPSMLLSFIICYEIPIASFFPRIVDPSAIIPLL